MGGAGVGYGSKGKVGSLDSQLSAVDPWLSAWTHRSIQGNTLSSEASVMSATNMSSARHITNHSRVAQAIRAQESGRSDRQVVRSDTIIMRRYPTVSDEAGVAP